MKSKNFLLLCMWNFCLYTNGMSVTKVCISYVCAIGMSVKNILGNRNKDIDTIHAVFQGNFHNPPIITNKHVYSVMVVTVLLIIGVLYLNSTNLNEFELQKNSLISKEKLLKYKTEFEKKKIHYLCKEKRHEETFECLLANKNEVNILIKDVENMSSTMHDYNEKVEYLQKYATSISSSKIQGDCLKMQNIHAECQVLIKELLEGYKIISNELKLKMALMSLHLENDSSFLWEFICIAVIFIVIFKLCCTSPKKAPRQLTVKRE